MHDFHLVLALFAGVLLVISLISKAAKRWVFLSEPMIAMLAGIALGPVALGQIDPRTWGDTEQMVEQAARVTLAIGLMGVALRLPAGYFKVRWKSLALLLGVAMPIMMAVSGLLTWAILGTGFWAAMLIGAVITPTDPIVATSIVTGPVAEKSLPERLRYLISSESGSNDGLALPLVMLPVYMLAHDGDLLHWAWRVLAWEVGLGVVVGLICGVAAGYALEMAERKDLIDRTSYLSYTIVLSLLTLGVAKLARSDGVLAVFIAGLAFDYVVTSNERKEEEVVQEAINAFFTMPVFVIFGMLLPWGAWAELGWPLLGLIVGVLLLRRLPAILLLKPWLPPLQSWGDALFMGWFGPIGVAALFYAMLALRETDEQLPWAVGSAVIAASILVHGITATPLTRYHGRRSPPPSDDPEARFLEPPAHSPS